MIKFLIAITISLFLLSCNTITKKIDSEIAEEEKNLSAFLNKSEGELKVIMGKPDRIEFKENNRNRFYIYEVKKLKIKCSRKFEINKRNIVIGYSSKNCF